MTHLEVCSNKADMGKKDNEKARKNKSIRFIFQGNSGFLFPDVLPFPRFFLALRRSERDVQATLP